MKPRHLLFCVSSVLATAGLPAQTAPTLQPTMSQTRTLHVRHFGPLLAAIDTNRDGVLTADELRLAPITLTALDLDEDGFLVRDEVSPARTGRSLPSSRAMFVAVPRMGPDAALMLVLDANHDGVVQPIEVANATSSLRRLDGNGDGFLTPEEFRAAARVTVVAANL